MSIPIADLIKPMSREREAQFSFIVVPHMHYKNVVLCYIHSFSSFSFPAYFSDLLLNRLSFRQRKFPGTKVPPYGTFVLGSESS